MPISHTQRLSDSDRAAIKAAAIELLADAIQFLKDLTDINTSNPPGLNYPEIASVLDKFLSSKGYDVEQVAIPPQLHPELVPFSDLPRLNVFARLKQCSGLQYSSLTAAWCLKQIGEDFQAEYSELYSTEPIWVGDSGDLVA